MTALRVPTFKPNGELHYLTASDGRTVNEYGTTVTVFTCETCGDVFTVTGEGDPEAWRNCLADECPSYDPNRDPYNPIAYPQGFRRHVEPDGTVREG